MISTAEYLPYAVSTDRWVGWGALLLGVYLGLAGVYWLPGLSITVVAAIKLALVGAAVFAVFSVALAKGAFALPTGLLGPIGFIVIVLAAAPGMFQAVPTSAMDTLLDVTLSFLFMWVFFVMAKRGAQLHSVFRLGVVVVVVFCLFTITNLFFSWPTWTSPFENVRLALHVTGFNAKRTGWSNGLAFMFPLTALFLMPRASKGGSISAGSVTLFYVSSIAIIVSQLICGGRAGLLSSLTVGFILFLFSPARKHYGVLVLAAIVASFFLSEYLFDQLRIYRLAASQFSTSTIDSFSAGRISGYLIAADLIAERPFAGYGFDQLALTDFGIGYQDVHNLWLRLATESGIILPILFAGMVGACVLRVRGLFRTVKNYERVAVHSFAAVVVSGVVLTFFEPNVLLGSFQNSAAWWAAMGALLGMTSRRASTAAHPIDGQDSNAVSRPEIQR